MRKLYLPFLLIFTLAAGRSFASHELPIINPTFSWDPTTLTLTFNGESDQATCASVNYWIEMEIVCGSTPNWANSSFVSGPTMLKPNCVQMPLPTFTFNQFCAGATYWVRFRERVQGATPNPPPASNWTPVYTFTVPGTPPPITITVTTTTEDTLCGGSSADLDVQVTGGCSGVGGYNYLWSPSTGVSDVNIANPTVMPTVTTTYKIFVTDDCTGFSDLDSVTIVVPDPIPAGSVAPQAGSGSSLVICEGDSAYLTLVGDSGVTYQWFSSTNGVTFNPVTGATTASYALEPVTTTTQFYVQVNGPAGSCPAETPKFTVSVVPAPTANVADSVKICEGDTATLSASGGVTYLWAPFSNMAPHDSSATVDLYPAVTTTYYVFVKNQFGCKGRDSVIVKVNPKPVPYTVTQPSICPLNNGAIVIDSINPGTAPYQFSIDGINYTSNQIFSSLSPGTYSLYVEDANGCKNIQSGINVSEIMDIVASFDVNTNSGLVPLEVNFTNTSSGSINDYYWELGVQGANSTDINPTYTYDQHGQYTVIMYAFGVDRRCFDTAMVLIDVIGQSSLHLANVFSPNGDGVNDIFTLNPVNLVDFRFEVFDQWGKKVAEITDPNQGWDGTRKGGGQASAGTYFYVYKGMGTDSTPYEGRGHVTLIRK